MQGHTSAQGRRRRAKCLLVVALLFATNMHPVRAQDGTDIAATVNGSAITIAEVDAIQRRTGQQGQSPEETRKAILAQLVLSELLAQQAKVAGLDNETSARAEALIRERSALAGLQLEIISRDQPNLLLPEDPRVNSLISENPKLFGERKLFIFDETANVAASAEFWAELGDGDSIAELNLLADKYGLSLSFATKALFSDQVPPMLLPAFETVDVGSLLVIKGSAEALTGRFISMRSVLEAPLVEADAVRVAQSILKDALQRQAINARAAQLLETSNVIYQGEFSQDQGALVSALPQGMTEQQRRRGDLISAALAIGLLFSLVTGFLATVSGRRYWTGQLYIPLVGWFMKDSDPELDINRPTGPFYDEDAGSALGKVVIFFLAPLFFMVLTAHGYYASLALNYGVVVVLLAAFPISILLAFKYSQSRLRVWSRDHRLAPVVAFSVLTMTVSLGSIYVAYYQ